MKKWYALYVALYSYSNDHYSDVIMNTIASQIKSGSIQAQIIENIKAPRHWSLWGESSQRASNAEMFPFDDVIMDRDSIA